MAINKNKKKNSNKRVAHKANKPMEIIIEDDFGVSVVTMVPNWFVLCP